MMIGKRAETIEFARQLEGNTTMQTFKNDTHTQQHNQHHSSFVLLVFCFVLLVFCFVYHSCISYPVSIFLVVTLSFGLVG